MEGDKFKRVYITLSSWGQIVWWVGGGGGKAGTGGEWQKRSPALILPLKLFPRSE